MNRKTKTILTIISTLLLFAFVFTANGAASQSTKSNTQKKQKKQKLENPIRSRAEKQIRNMFGYGRPTKIILNKATLATSSDLLGSSVKVSGWYQGKALSVTLIDNNLPIQDKNKDEIVIYRYNKDKYYSQDQGYLDY